MKVVSSQTSLFVVHCLYSLTKLRNLNSDVTERRGTVVMLYIRSLEVLGLNPGWDTGCLDSGFYAFDVELRLSPRWVGDIIGSTDATKTYHTLNAYIFETNNREVINNTSLDSFKFKY
jgi:hypothetical protein